MRFLLKAITNFQSSKRQTRHKISTEKLPTTQEIVRNWEIRKICQQSAKFALLTIFSLCRKSKRSKPKMDNLKKVLTNRPELAGCLYKYTNVVKGKFDLFSWQNIYLHNYLRNSQVSSFAFVELMLRMASCVTTCRRIRMKIHRETQEAKFI